MRRGLPSPIRVVVSGLAALGAVLTLAACGSGSAAGGGPTVTLALSSPANASRTSSAQITVTGRVSPSSGVRVEVLGRPARVSATGTFSGTVGLSVGSNLIDVIAAAPRSAGAVQVLEVTRFELVTMPAVTGEHPGQAIATLRSLGLRVQVVGSDDPLNGLLPGSNSVCSSTPSAGTRIDPGTAVVIKTSKLCF